MRLPLLLPLLLLSLLCPPSLAQRQPRTPAELEAAAQVKALFPGQPVEVVIDEQTNTGTATGVGGEASGDKAEFNQNVTPPGLTFGQNSGTGGGGSAGGTARSAASDLVLKLMAFGVGALCLAGAGVCVFRGYKVPRAPVVLAVLGGGFIAIAFFPLLLVFGLLAAVGVLVAHLIIAERGAAHHEAASTAAITGINQAENDASNPEAQKAAKVVKEYIASVTDGKSRWVRDVIRKVKNKLD